MPPLAHRLLLGPRGGRLLVFHFHPALSAEELLQVALGVHDRPLAGERQASHGHAVWLVYLTNAATSFRRNPYSASARIATRLCSQRDTSSPSIVTVA